MPTRTLKLEIPDKVTILNLPLCATILSVGIQRSTPVVWFETPEVSGMKDILSNAGFDEDCWPTVNIKFEVVPTGEFASNGMKFVGTVVRPRRSDPTRTAVFHIYVEESKFIHTR